MRQNAVLCGNGLMIEQRCTYVPADLALQAPQNKSMVANGRTRNKGTMMVLYRSPEC